MNWNWRASFKLAGAVVAAGLLAAWMTPPTTPKPPAESSWRAEARARQTVGPAAPPTPADYASLSPPKLPYRGVYSSSRGPVAAASDAPREPPAAAKPEPVVERIEVADARADEPSWPEQDRLADDRDRYRAGYDWASRVEVEDARDCRRLRGDPGEDGCLDFVREQEERWAARDDRARDGYGW